jgi:hypothetical protein
MVAAPVSLATPRLAFLDMTKGILVLLMAVYHSLNYTDQYHLGFRFLSFLPPSFILITGLLIAVIYVPRYEAGDRRLVARLLARGAKLVVLFTALNIAAQFVRSPTYGRSVGLGAFLGEWHRIYVLGSGGYTAAFEVLLPIAYLLLFGPLLVIMASRQPILFTGATGVVIVTCAVLDQRGIGIPNLNLWSAGLLGMMIGCFAFNPAALRSHVWFSLVAYIVYFPLGVAKGYTYTVQLLGAIVALALAGGFSIRWGEDGWWQQRLIRLGQYSLLSYIVQIAILQVLSRFLGRPAPGSLGGVTLFLTTLLLMTVIVEVTEVVRSRSRGAERVYRSIFA